MASELSDTGVYGALLSDGKEADAQGVPPRAGQAGAGRIHAREDEWRTPPLWGLHHSAPYLHDGRAATIDEAIRLHGGEAAPSAHRYRQLAPRDRGQLERFLDSLEAPPGEALGDVAGK